MTYWFQVQLETEWKPPLHQRRGHFSWISSPCSHSQCIICLLGDWSLHHVKKWGWGRGAGGGQERKWGLSHFRGELSSRSGLGVVYQNLSKAFPKSNTLNLTTLATQDTHFKPQSSAQAFCQHWQSLPELWSCHELHSCSWRRYWPSKQKTSESFHSNFRKPPWLWITGRRWSTPQNMAAMNPVKLHRQY